MVKHGFVVFRFGLWEAGLLLAALLGLSACSNSGGEDDASGRSIGTSTVTVPGTVNTREIGGTNLSVLSAYDNGSVGPLGFTITVARESAQLLFVEDGNGDIRGLAFPVTRGAGEGQAIQIDATSTALGLIFLSPGITTVDPSLAQSRIFEFTALPSFMAVVTFLKNALPTQNLTTLRNGQLHDLLNTCITDWLNDQKLQIALREQSSVTTDRMASVVPTVTAAQAPQDITKSEAGLVRLSRPRSPSDATAIPITVENYGLRYVKLYKVPYDLNNEIVGNQVTLVPTGTRNLKGKIPAGSGDIAVGRTGNPTTMQDTVNLSSIHSKVQYWIVGASWNRGKPFGDMPALAGHGAHGPLNPVDLSIGADTFFEYLLPPIMKGITGAALKDDGMKLIVSILTDALRQKLPGPAGAIYTICCSETADLLTRASAMMDFLRGLVEELARHPEAYIEIKNLVSLLKKVELVFAAVNLAAVSYDLSTVPHVAVVELTPGNTNNWNGTWVGAGTGGCDQPIPIAIAYRVSGASGESGSLSFTIIPPSDPVHNVVGATFTLLYEGNIARPANPSIHQTNTLNGDTMTETYPEACWTATLSRQ